MNFEDIREKVKYEVKKLGFTDWEITFSGSEATNIIVRNLKIDNFENSIQKGIAFRGNINGKTGYSYSEKIDEESIVYLVKEAAENAEIIEEEEEIFFEGSDKYPEVKTYFDEIENITVEQLVNNAISIEKGMLDSSKYIKSSDYCIFGKSSNKNIIFNSKGIDISFKQNMALGYISGIAENNNDIKTGSEYWFGNDINNFNAEVLGNKAGQKIVSHIGAKSIKSDNINIVFENEVMSNILATFSSIFFAENVQKGFSMLKNKNEEIIASDILNIKDDGICEKSGYSIPFDSEGVAIQNKYVVKNGVLKTLLYNIKSAVKDNVKSTGNGFRIGIKSPVVTTCTNFYIDNGDMTKEEVFKNVQNGLLITDVAGLHSGTNVVSGDFSLSAEGFLIENGNITTPIEQITVAGNFYDILKNIKCIANDIKFSMPIGIGVFGSPTIFVGKMSVSGL